MPRGDAIYNPDVQSDIDMKNKKLLNLDIPGSGIQATLAFSESLVNTAGTVTLVNDSTTPGNSKYYGTDSGGVKGFFTFSGTGANPTGSVGLTAVNGSQLTFMRSDAAPPLDQSIAPTWTGNHTWSFNGIANIKTLLLTNTAAATNGTTSQPSHILQFHGSGWHTTGGGASDTIDFQLVLVPFSASTTARARLTFSSQTNSGGYSDLLALFASGGMSLGTDADPGAGKFNASNGIYVNGSPALTPTGLKLVHESNATAETDTFFYSTDTSGLAYKDALNVVHPITGAGTSATIQSTLSNLKGDNAGNAIAATETGTGDTVLATSPTLITPTIGVATATSVNKWTLTAPSTAATLTAGADNLTYTMPEISTKVGFRHIPQNSQSASYTTVLNDSGKHIYHPAADANNRTITIDSNANVAYPIGTAIMFVNMSANNLSIAITADTMYLAGTGTTGTRTLAQYGKATAVKSNTTEWIISGVGLS